MRVALTILPTFTDKSIPLGLACINGALREAGHGVQVYDFDYLLSVEDKDLYWKVHAYAWGNDARIVNYLGGSDLELILRTVFPDDEWLENLEKRDPDRRVDITSVRSFVAGAARLILSDAPEQVWFSTYVSNIWLSMLAARAIREIDPSIPIGFGGPAIHAAEVQRFLLLNGIVDHCFVGEGEKTAVDFATSGQTVDGVATIVNGAYTYRPRKLASKLRELPRPDFTGFPFPQSDIRAYLRRSFEGLPVSFSRGCVEKCSFCAESNIWQRFRTKDHGEIIEELSDLQQRYGISLFYNCDSLVNFTAEWLGGLCDAICAADFNCAFSFAFVRGTRLPQWLAEKMVRAGFTRTVVGAEHGSQRMLDRMHKGTSQTEIEQVICDTAAAGLSVRVGTIVNFPGETIHDVLEEIALFKRIDDTLLASGVPSDQLPQRSLANSFRLEPCTRIVENPGQHGIRISSLPNPLDRDPPGLAELLKGWDYSQPQDTEFNAYVASHFSNEKERWDVPAHLSKRLARGLQDFIRDEDSFGLAPGVEIVPAPDGSAAIRTVTRVLPLNEMMFVILGAVSSGRPLCDVRADLSGRYTIAPDMIRRLAALMFVEQVLIFRHIAPPSGNNGSSVSDGESPLPGI